jgi:hypothetical protein
MTTIEGELKLSIWEAFTKRRRTTPLSFERGQFGLSRKAASRNAKDE